MININHPPSEIPQAPATYEPEEEGSQTLMVPPPTLRERIAAAQRARTLQIQPTVTQPETEEKSEAD